MLKYVQENMCLNQVQKQVNKDMYIVSWIKGCESVRQVDINIDFSEAESMQDTNW